MIELQVWKPSAKQYGGKVDFTWERVDDVEDEPIIVDLKFKDMIEAEVVGEYLRPAQLDNVMDWLAEEDIFEVERVMRVIALLKLEEDLYIKFIER